MKHVENTITFTNPRMFAEIEDWPIGRQRCRARFTVETHPKRGQRVSRVTENKTRTGWNKPKTVTYAARFIIVDGSDGRLYLLSSSRYGSDSVIIWPGTLKTNEYVYRDSSPERYAELLPLFDQKVDAWAAPSSREP